MAKSRRLVISATALSVALLSACGGTTTVGAPSSSADASSVAAFPTQGSGEVHIYNWTGYIDPDGLDAFEKETGIHPVLDTYDSNETALAKLQSGVGGYDVVFPSDYMVDQMVKLNLLEKIDVVDTFPNGPKITSNMVDVYWDKGRHYSAPWMYGSTGIACNVTAEPRCNEIKSWKDYFTIGLPKMDSLKDQVEVVSSALRATGVAAADLCTTDKSKYAAAQKLLEGFSPAVIDSDGGLERVDNGTSNVREAWNGETYRMKEHQPGTIFIYPTEGLNFWADNMVVVKGAPDLDNAKIFINWMMDPQHIAQQSAYTGYNNAIDGSADFLPEAMKTDPAVVPPADAVARMSPTPACEQEARDLYTQVFTTWLAKQS